MFNRRILPPRLSVSTRRIASDLGLLWLPKISSCCSSSCLDLQRPVLATLSPRSCSSWTSASCSRHPWRSWRWPTCYLKKERFTFNTSVSKGSCIVEICLKYSRQFNYCTFRTNKFLNFAFLNLSTFNE